MNKILWLETKKKLKKTKEKTPFENKFKQGQVILHFSNFSNYMSQTKRTNQIELNSFNENKNKKTLMKKKSKKKKKNKDTTC